MPQIRHVATCTNNNRRIARFYRLIFGMEELWNDKRTHPYAYYITDGYVNLTCLQFYAGLMRKPDVGIEHFGFYVDDVQETVKKIAAFDSSIKLEDSPEDGRYEDKRFHDPEGNRLEIASNTWGTEGIKNIPRIRHIAIHAKDLECLCDFYKSVFGMKEITRKITRDTESTVVYLSDNDFSLTLIKNAPVARFGIQLFGIQVPSIGAIEERLIKSPPFLYPGEPPVEVIRRVKQGPFETCYLRDPDGTYVDLSENGWPS